MTKKIWSLYVVCAICAVTLYACKCKDKGDFISVYSIYLEWYNDQPVQTDHQRYAGDTLKFDFVVNTNCIAQNTTNFSPFISTAYATVPTFCPCGQSGFRKGINNLKVYTDNNYAGYTAGSEITSLFSFYTVNYDSMNIERRTFYDKPQVPDVLMQNSIASHQERIGINNFRMLLTQKPGDTLLHTFTVYLITADTTYTATCPPVKWF